MKHISFKQNYSKMYLDIYNLDHLLILYYLEGIYSHYFKKAYLNKSRFRKSNILPKLLINNKFRTQQSRDRIQFMIDSGKISHCIYRMDLTIKSDYQKGICSLILIKICLNKYLFHRLNILYFHLLFHKQNILQDKVSIDQQLNLCKIRICIYRFLKRVLPRSRN